MRALTPSATAIVARGLERSASFRALVQRLDRSDVVVYVKDDRMLTRALAARLNFMASAGDLRYVIVHVARRLTASQQVASLGHELQHAIEIAERPGIVDGRSLAAEYAAFAIMGALAHGIPNTFETHRAMTTAQRILGELMP